MHLRSCGYGFRGGWLTLGTSPRFTLSIRVDLYPNLRCPYVFAFPRAQMDYMTKNEIAYPTEY